MITAALETASKDNKRYFVDVRVGCVAIRDRQHPTYNPEYHGLSSELEDVVEYVEGKREFDLFVSDDAEVERLYKRCEQLNNDEETSTPEENEVNEDEDRRLNIVEWLRAFHSGEFDFSDRGTQIKAGWYDWFCNDSSLRNKTIKLGKILKRVLKANEVSKKFDPTKCCVFFKNNCPVYGRLYDDLRICDIETNDILFTIIPECGHYSTPDSERTQIYVASLNDKLTFPNVKSLIDWFKNV